MFNNFSTRNAANFQTLQTPDSVITRWNLYERLGCEFDEYDTPASVHVVALADGDFVGCMRLLRTDNSLGQATYMILDAHRGKIPNLPSEILYEEISSPQAWEASRLAIASSVPIKSRNQVLIALMNGAKSYIKSRDGSIMLGMMNPLFMRVFERAGMTVKQFGPVASQRDGKICVIRHDF